jgi:hypothetical protein
MVTCQQWREDDEGRIIQTRGVCANEAQWVCCVPFVGALLCDEHKCRCAKPIGAEENEPVPPLVNRLLAASLMYPEVGKLLREAASVLSRLQFKR